ncbi:macrophage migration inhibitory factor homolog [Olea europaea var. sylvestris]|uniref:Macrophage migration inhibitory factor homolog n=2 Tax=Olea europaea subsp. europaea TaxID=158383 RepID=A0A8S0Q2P2_OLEEU|nr:macrophage migration inhibitory factor homolog [Olea europaea var. sylvestris]CAA2960493.1 macrophage migration inhibitory factor homolog [Olea europaea subsp. europaea]
MKVSGQKGVAHKKIISKSPYRQEKSRKKRGKMPCLDISTNVNLDGINTDSIFSELTKAVSQIIGKPEKFVMILLKGSVTLTFGGNKEPAALAEIVSMGGINTEVKRKLIATLGSILENKLYIPRTRFVLKVFDTTMGRQNSKL